MAEPKWYSLLPADAADVFPDCDDEVDLRDGRYVGAALISAAESDRPELVNVVLERCDIAGFVARDGRADRVLLRGSRLRGVIWANGLVRDVHLVDVLAAETSFRFSELRRVVFRDCKLPAMDFTRATLDDVHFENCDLTGATFDDARTSGRVRFERCDLTRASGVAALRGASIHPDDLISLAPSMAEALGFVVEAE